MEFLLFKFLSFRIGSLIVNFCHSVKNQNWSWILEPRFIREPLNVTFIKHIFQTAVNSFVPNARKKQKKKKNE